MSKKLRPGSYTVKQLSEILGYSKRWINEWILNKDTSTPLKAAIVKGAICVGEGNKQSKVWIVKITKPVEL